MTSKLTAGQMFCACVKGQNFVTPKVLKYILIGEIGNIRRVAELSEGTGIFSEEMIYGVSVVDYNIADDTSSRPEGLSKACHSETEVRDYIGQLRGLLNR